jgi:hypothetical protein
MNRTGTREPDGDVETAAPAALDSGGLQAALQRVQEAQGAVPGPGNGAPARDRLAHSNRAAFLALEDERRAIATRLQRSDRHRGERYRDLVLITKLSRLEHEHLVGGIENGAGASAPAEDPPALGREAPADWGRPWAVGPLVELRATYADNRSQRDRVARQLLPWTRASIAAESERSFERIVDRFEALREASDPMPKANGEMALGSRGRRLRVPRIPHVAAAAAGLGLVVVAVAVAANLDTGTPASQASIPAATAADLGGSLPALEYRRPAGTRHHKDTKRPPRKPEASDPQVEPVAVAPVRPHRSPRTVSAAPPPPAPAPAAPAPAPAPQPSSGPPAPQPSGGGGGSNGGNGNGGGPVSSLPPPVNSLPPPGSGG